VAIIYLNHFTKKSLIFNSKFLITCLQRRFVITRHGSYKLLVTPTTLPLCWLIIFLSIFVLQSSLSNIMVCFVCLMEVFGKIITYFRKLNFFIFSLFQENNLMPECTNFYDFSFQSLF